jgi:uncharacterized RDD family membrane protein YckC
MMCPVCKRDLAPTLSICFTCGAMVNDSVREELELKIGPVSGRLNRSATVAPAPVLRTEKPKEAAPIKREVAAPPVKVAEQPAQRTPGGETTEFGRKNTSPTLVGFQPKTSTVPDWRLQLQNAIRQRGNEVAPASAVVAVARNQNTAAAKAPKAKPVETPAPTHQNPRVAAALQRIESSRRRFLESDAPAAKAEVEAKPATRNYPFNVVSRGGEPAARVDAPQATVNTLPKPRLVTSAKIEKKKYDTNKLPPLPVAAAVAAAVKTPEPIEGFVELEEVRTPAAIEAEVLVEAKPEPKKLPMIIDDLAEEYGIAEEADDDLAAIPSRFLAGLFDSIIGAFAAGIVLAPFLMSGGEWMTVSGSMTIMAAFGVVMFAYMTIAIGLRGRTVGMRLFGIEVIDAEENEYPSMHQAAVSSAVYLLSLPMLGLGFLPLLFNEERRAAHDLISGTVLVREI